MKSTSMAMLMILMFTGQLASGADSPRNVLSVYKTPQCGCCSAWIDHMKANGFAATVIEQSNLRDLKNEHGVRPGLDSCHTAISSDRRFVFEGHIPALIVASFLKDPPEDAIGLTVPGMPMGSPGMEMGDHFQPYEVLIIRRDGSVEKYASITKPEQQY